MLARSLIAAGALGAGLWGAYLWKRSLARPSQSHTRDIVDSTLVSHLAQGAQFVLFTSRYCIPCGELKSALDHAGVHWQELPVEENAHAFRSLGIGATPVLVEVGPEGVAIGCWGPDSIQEAKDAISLAGGRSRQTASGYFDREAN